MIMCAHFPMMMVLFFVSVAVGGLRAAEIFRSYIPDFQKSIFLEKRCLNLYTEKFGFKFNDHYFINTWDGAQVKIEPANDGKKYYVSSFFSIDDVMSRSQEEQMVSKLPSDVIILLHPKDHLVFLDVSMFAFPSYVGH